MASFRAEEDHLEDVEDFLDRRKQWKHLRARRRGDVIVIESGPKTDVSNHVRLRRISAQQWSLDISDHLGRWEPTPYVAALDALLKQIARQFAWVLEPRD